MEIWKDIKGYEGFYMVSTKGRIKSLDRLIIFKSKGKEATRRIKGKILNLYLRKDGYLDVSLRKHGDKNVFLVHRIVSESFLENKNKYPVVNHINCIKSDNRVENLEWCTHKQNIDHACKNNLYKNRARGSRVTVSKLTELDVLDIKKRILNKERNVEISKHYNIDPSVISCIRHNKIWKHVQL